jgi:hypothetical protein
MRLHIETGTHSDMTVCGHGLIENGTEKVHITGTHIQAHIEIGAHINWYT